MDDLISRQAAIEAIKEQIFARLDWLSDSRMERKGLDVALCVIEDLPSADPEIVRCKDCKHRTEPFDTRWHHCTDVPTNGDWYCADAERRTDD